HHPSIREDPVAVALFVFPTLIAVVGASVEEGDVGLEGEAGIAEGSDVGEFRVLVRPLTVFTGELSTHIARHRGVKLQAMKTIDCVEDCPSVAEGAPLASQHLAVWIMKPKGEAVDVVKWPHLGQSGLA